MNAIPTPAQIKTTIINNMGTEYVVTLNPAWKSFLNALAGALAGIYWLIYLFLGAIQANIWVDTCDVDMLTRYGIIILGRYMFNAVPGQYTLSVTGSAGAVIPGTMVFVSNDSSLSPGQNYQIQGGAYALTGTGDTITVLALSGGVASRLSVGDGLTANAPMILVNANATVTAETVIPIDAETVGDYRAAVIEKIQAQPGSWSATDYRLVGLGIDGVQQIYAYNHSGQSATVDIFIQGTTPVAYPGPSVGSTVITNYTNALVAVDPLGVWQVNYNSSPINNIDFTITMGAFTPFTPAQKALIQSALTNFVNSITPFIAASDNPNTRNDIIASYNLNSIISAAIPGYGFSGVTFTVTNASGTSSVAEWQADQGNIAFMNSITYA